MGILTHDELFSNRGELWITIISCSIYAVGTNSVAVDLASVPRPSSRLTQINPTQQHRQFFMAQYHLDFSGLRLGPAETTLG
jgi:hypothetical protein